MDFQSDVNENNNKHIRNSYKMRRRIDKMLLNGQEERKQRRFYISPPSIDVCMHLRSGITKCFASDKCIESVDPHAQNNSILIACMHRRMGKSKAKQTHFV